MDQLSRDNSPTFGIDAHLEIGVVEIQHWLTAPIYHLGIHNN